MRSILRSTAVLATGSSISLVVGLLATKAYALLLGPSLVGRLGLLSNLLWLGCLVAGLGVSTSLVRLGAEPARNGERARVAALRRAAWRLFVVVGGLSAACAIAAAEPLGRLLLGAAEHGGEVRVLAVALLLLLAAEIQNGLLNAHHRVSALARVRCFHTLAGSASGVLLVCAFGRTAVPWVVLASAASYWVVSRFFLRREIDLPRVSVPSREAAGAVRELARFGAPYTLSAVVGRGVLLALPVLVLHVLGEESVGYHRAVALISVNYLGFLVVAMGQDYYPRVAAVASDPQRTRAVLNEQQRVVLLLSVPVILCTLAAAPLVISLVFSPDFLPATTLLEWHLVGDLLRFSSWTLGFVVLARSSSAFLITELIGGAAVAAASWAGMLWFGLTGLGLGFSVAYAVYYLAVWAVVRKEVGRVWDRDNVVLLCSALGAALLLETLPLVGLGFLRAPLGWLVALLAGAYSLTRLRKELRRHGNRHPPHDAPAGASAASREAATPADPALCR